MKLNRFVLFMAVIGMVALLAACGSGGSKDDGSKGASGNGPAVSVNVVASDWKWDLDKTTFNVGDNITFNLTSSEGMHGFAITGTKVSQPIAKGQTKTVTWSPTKAGEYTIHCDVMCGTGHADMVTKITVN